MTMEDCNICSTIPFEALFDGSEDPRSYVIGELREIYHNAPLCAFCAFLVESHKLAYDLPKNHVLSGSDHLVLSFNVLPRPDDPYGAVEPWFEQAGVSVTAKPGPFMWLQFDDPGLFFESNLRMRPHDSTRITRSSQVPDSDPAKTPGRVRLHNRLRKTLGGRVRGKQPTSRSRQMADACVTRNHPTPSVSLSLGLTASGSATTYPPTDLHMSPSESSEAQVILKIPAGVGTEQANFRAISSLSVDSFTPTSAGTASEIVGRSSYPHRASDSSAFTVSTSQAPRPPGIPSLPYQATRVIHPPCASLHEPFICVSYVPSKALGSKNSTQNSGIIPRRRHQAGVDTGRLDFGLIQHWLKICETYHDNLCREPTNFKRKALNIRLVDVYDKRVVLYNGYDPYVAMSYVWGSVVEPSVKDFWKNVDSKAKSFALPSSLPKTVEDAISFTRSIGKRYLWVDAYCIKQNDAVDLQEQISTMHFVYECAWLTIGAVDGNNANAGISGISRDFAQYHQPHVTTDFGDFTSTFIYPSVIKDGSTPLERRAWTLQELIISKKHLFLNESFVSMRCSTQVFFDFMDVELSAVRPSVKLSDTHFWENGLGIDIYERRLRFWTFNQIVSSFTKRDLSDINNALSACSGALNQITRFTGVGFSQGIPKAHSHLALLWKPHYRNVLTRRPFFSSWSWVGWNGQADYHFSLAEMEFYMANRMARRHGKARKKRSHDVFEDNPIFHDDEADVTEMPEGSLRISSRVARVRTKLIRRDGTRVVGLTTQSQQEKVAVGDHWLVLNKSGCPLANEIGELPQFEPTDYSFRVHPEISEELKYTGGECDLIFIKYFPYLRDHPLHGRSQWRYDYVACLVILTADNHKAKRIGMIFLTMREWAQLEPQLTSSTLE